MGKVDYDRVAPVYDERYRINDLPGVGRAVMDLAARLAARRAAAGPDPAAEGSLPPRLRVVEVGCGTGHWLRLLASRPLIRLTGLDRSAGMLAKAQDRFRGQGGPGSGASVLPGWVRGTAEQLPLASGEFDLALCILALHHFSDPPGSILEIYRLLAPGGAVLVVNMDPHRGTDRWVVYDYFPETQALDLERYPRLGVVGGWLRSAGFRGVTARPVEQIRRSDTGEAVFSDPILGRGGTSQLALLSDRAYTAGIERIRAAIQSAARSGAPAPRFITRIDLFGVVGTK